MAAFSDADSGATAPTSESEPDAEPVIEAPSTVTAIDSETTGEVRYMEGDTPSVEEGDMVPASEIKELREVADMLYRQAEYEGQGDARDKKAEFIAKELRDRLDEILVKNAG